MPATEVPPIHPPPDSSSVESSTEGRATPSLAPFYAAHTDAKRPMGDAQKSLDAMAVVCAPVLIGLLAPGGVVGGFLFAWLLFA